MPSRIPDGGDHCFHKDAAQIFRHSSFAEDLIISVISGEHAIG